MSAMILPEDAEELSSLVDTTRRFIHEAKAALESQDSKRQPKGACASKEGEHKQDMECATACDLIEFQLEGGIIQERYLTEEEQSSGQGKPICLLVRDFPDGLARLCNRGIWTCYTILRACMEEMLGLFCTFRGASNSGNTVQSLSRLRAS